MVSPRSHQCETFEGLLGGLGSFRHSDQQKRNNSSECCVFLFCVSIKSYVMKVQIVITNEELRCLLCFFFYMGVLRSYKLGFVNCDI